MAIGLSLVRSASTPGSHGGSWTLHRVTAIQKRRRGRRREGRSENPREIPRRDLAAAEGGEARRRRESESGEGIAMRGEERRSQAERERENSIFCFL